jgi:hypothetical protein
MGKYNRLFRMVVAVGGIPTDSLRDDQQIFLSHMQEPAGRLAEPSLESHTEELFGEHYVGLIVSDVLGAQYTDEFNQTQTTPDFDILRPAYDSTHWAKSAPNTITRTCLTIDLVPKSLE